MPSKIFDLGYEYLLTDPKLGPVLKKYGKGKIGRKGDTYEALTRAIIFQQLSGKAAGSIYKKYSTLFTNGVPTWQQFFKKKRDILRSAGISNQKCNYLYDLSCKFRDGFIQPKLFPKMTDEQIREHLVAVKGIGVWTADMFLIFTLGRPDVLPTGDLGVRKGYQILFKMSELPDHSKMEKLAKKWAPYRTIASWYLWKVADEAKEKKEK